MEYVDHDLLHLLSKASLPADLAGKSQVKAPAAGKASVQLQSIVKMALLIVMLMLLSFDWVEADSGSLSTVNGEIPNPRMPFVCARSKDWDDSDHECLAQLSTEASVAADPVPEAPIPADLPGNYPPDLSAMKFPGFGFHRIEGPDSDGIIRVVYRNNNLPKAFFDAEGDDDSDST